MRPRLIAVDDVLNAEATALADEASMRPRLIAVDDGNFVAEKAADAYSFNEATAYCRG